MSHATTNGTTAARTKKGNALAGVGTWVDDRTGLATMSKKQIRKVFPDHWSFMLGEIALWSFVVLLLTGTFLTLWFKPSMTEVVYNGSYDQFPACTCRRPTPPRWTSPSTSAAACSTVADAPLVRAAVHRGDVRAHDARLAQWCVPQAA